MGNVIIPKTVNYGGLPYDVKSIGEAAFFECKALETLNFNAIACEDYFEDLETPIIPALYGLKINTVNIGNRVTRLPAGFIMGCTGFSAIEIGNSVKTIGDLAFADCSGLSSISLGKSVTSIGHNAFNTIFEVGPKLQSVRNLATTPPVIFEDTFMYSHFTDATLYVPINAIDDYANVEYWKYFSTILF